jgi:hypothetical protein
MRLETLKGIIDRRSALALSACALLVGGSAGAADQGITGKKLLLKSTPKLVLLSKDAGIGIAGSDPVGGADSSISFDDGGGPVTFSLPKTNWSTNGSGTLFKYKNKSAPGGPSAVKIAKVKPGLLKVVAKGLPFAVPNGSKTIGVVLSLDEGTNTYCMSFSGTGDGDKFLVKDAAAGSCVPPQTCGNDVREGTEVCDGTSDDACPGNCLVDCTCSVCGNDVREGSEECDGTDATACPGDCLADCTCAQPCPASGGDSTACEGLVSSPPCQTCCAADTSCNVGCGLAFFEACLNAADNDVCAASVNAAGCAAVCCN